MIREYLSERLSQQCGKPTKNPSADWWTIGACRPYPIHICLNEPTRHDRAHVLIYDPRATEGSCVIEAWVCSIEEIDQLCQRINLIVKTNERAQR